MKLTPPVSRGSDLSQRIRDAIGEQLPGSLVTVTAGNPGHYGISVTSEEFRGKNRVTCQRLVYKAIGPLMQGDNAPLHAVDQLETKAP